MVEIGLEDNSESSSIFSSRKGKEGAAVEDCMTSDPSSTLQGKTKSLKSFTWRIFKAKFDGK